MLSKSKYSVKGSIRFLDVVFVFIGGVIGVVIWNVWICKLIF